MKRNTSGQHIAAQMNSRIDGLPLTSSVSIYVTGDGGTQTAGSGVLTHKGNGHWDYSPTQAETNYEHIAFTFTHSNGIDQTVQVYTGVDVVFWKGSTAPDFATLSQVGTACRDTDNTTPSAGSVGDGIKTIKGKFPGLKKTGAVASDGSNSATSFKTDLTETEPDHWKDTLLQFTSGDLDGQVKRITAYNQTTKFVTVQDGFTKTPSASDAFILVNQ